MKFLQKSFARGILSPNVITRQNVSGYDESARELYNVHIGNQGEIYKRGGLGVMASLDIKPVRVIPFKSSDGNYLITFSTGKITDNNSSKLVNAANVRVFKIDDWEFNKKNVSFNKGDFYRGERVNVYGKGAEDNIDIWKSYWIPVDDGLSTNELLSMDYTQLGSIIVFCGESFPPFVIRKEESGFVYYRNFMDMLFNGNEAEENNITLNKVIKTLPFNYYGYGIQINRARYYDSREYEAFIGHLVLNENYDQFGLAKKNLKFWENRAFIVSTFDDENEDNIGVTLYGGIIKKLKITNNTDPSQYEVSGFFKSLNGAGNLKEEWLQSRKPNLHLCDWSEELGWPVSVTTYENRLVYASNSAFPNKIWFSAQPSIQKVKIGEKETISYANAENEAGNASERVESRSTQPITVPLYFEQTDLFSIELSANGFLPLQATSPGNVFINDNLGFRIHWIIGGELLFIGTDIGIFTSQGTIIQNNNPVPFNAGFIRATEIPVKRVLPTLIEEALYFISQDNSVQILNPRNERGGYTTQTLDNFSREVIRDVWTKSIITKTLKKQDIQANVNVIPSIVEDIVEDTNSGPSTGLSYIGLNINTKTNFRKTFFGQRQGFPPFISNALFLFAGRLSGFRSAYGLEGYGFEVSNNRASLEFDREVLEENSRYEDWTILNLIGDISDGFIFIETIIDGTRVYSLHRYTISRGNISIETSIRSLRTYANDKGKLVFGNKTEGFIVELDRTYYNEGGNFNRLLSYSVSGSSLNISELSISRRNVNNIFSGDWKEIAKSKFVIGNNVGLIFVVSTGKIYKYSISGTNITFTELNIQTSEINNFKKIAVDGDENKGIFILLENSRNQKDNKIYKYSVSRTDITFTELNSTNRNLTKGSDTWIDLNTNTNKIDIFQGSFDFDNDALDRNEDVYIRDFFSGTFLTKDDVAQPQENNESDDVNNREELEVNLEVDKSKEYDVFNSNTRMLYDWSRRILFLVRKDSPYLALSYNRETGVLGWSRGDMDLSDVNYLPSVSYRPPESFPTLVGLKDNNILMLSQGLHAQKQQFVDNLPNCLDNFVLLEKVSKSLDLDDLKNSLENIGYNRNDPVVIASDIRDDKIFIKKFIRLRDMEGSLRIPRNNALIVGIPYGMHLKTWQPLMPKASMLGEQFSISQIVFNSLKNSDVLMNNNFVKKKQNIYSNYEINGNQFIKQVVQSSLDFDPTIEIKTDSPLPFAMGGFILEIN